MIEALKKQYKEGFTLIELLVVIAIIGILAAIVLVSMSGARDQAKNAAIQSALSEVRNASEMLFIATSSYSTICASQGGSLSSDGDFGRIKTSIEQNGGEIKCYSNSSAYAVSSLLNGGGYWCVDSTGVSKKTTNEVSTTTCPAS